MLSENDDPYVYPLLPAMTTKGPGVHVLGREVDRLVCLYKDVAAVTHVQESQSVKAHNVVLPD